MENIISGRSMSKPVVIIYRNFLLPPSETFIRAQVSSMENFDGYYVGSRRVEGLSLPRGQIITVREAKISTRFSELVYRFSGFSPSLYQRIQVLAPKLIHAHFGPDAIKAIPISKKLGLPLIVTFHGYDATVKPSHAVRASYSQMLYILRKRKLKTEAVQFLTTSDFIKGLLLEQGFPSGKIATHYIGIDPTMFTMRESIPREIIVLFVGRLVEMKGCKFLVSAMSRVQSRCPNAKLVVIGDGPLRKSLEKFAAQKLSNFNFLGFSSPSVVKEWMNRSMVFCVPSITATSGHAEGFGIVFAEAQSMGLPVVSFDSGGISEVVAHGETGFLAPEKDERALAEYILQILENPSLWQKFSQCGMNRVRLKFDLNLQTRKLEKIYSQVIARHKSNP
ncbi:MAG: glycosyltransferase [Phormidesmis sp.]